MPKQILRTVAVVLWCTARLSAQLSGTYTIGGAGADFSNLTHAVQQLYTAGVGGPVTFKIRPGEYQAATISAIPGSSPARRVVFESETGDSLGVVIRGKSEFNKTRWVTFRRLSLVGTGNQKQAVVRLLNTHGVRLENCHVTETLPVSYDYDEGLVKIYTLQSADSVQADFLNCYLNSASKSIVARGEYGTFLFQGCTMTGDWDFWLSEYQGRFWYNDITFHSEGGDYAKELYYNTLRTEEFALDLTCGSFVGNRVTQKIHLNSYTVEENDFEGEADLSYQPGSGIQRNTFRKDFSIAYCYNAKLLANRFFGNTRISFCDGMEVCNNFVYGDLEITHGGDYRVLHNNFARGSHFTMHYTSGMVRNNNFSNVGILNLTLTTIQDNNYYPTEGIDYVSYMDKHPRFYDPRFVDNATDLHATNRLLTAKAGLISFVSTARDIDGNKRPYPTRATIGANEICYKASDFPDTVWVSCTENSLLRWCNAAEAGQYFWTTTDFADTLPANATIQNDASRLLYLHGPAGVEDSVYFAIQPFPDSILSGRKYYFWCGSEFTLTTYAPPGATVSWEPADGLSDPNSPKPVFYAQDTVTYVATIQTGQCALLRDTLRIFVDQRPRAGFEPIDEGNGRFRFYNFSTCADQHQWDFGDSTFSTEADPTHQYIKEGLYTVTLVVTNDYGTASFQRPVYVVFTTGVAGGTDQPEDALQVYPNPGSGRFTLAMEAFQTEDNLVELTNTNGQVLHSWRISGQAFAELEARVPGGWYCLFIRNKLGVFRKPLLLQADR